MSKEKIAFDKKSFIINGKRVLLIGGEFHYFRTPNQLWEDRLVKMKRSGANLVSTYIPWSWHEPREGQERWSGDQDLIKFIELCQKHGLYLAVKPGPYICAEWDFGGHPDWILSKKIPIRVLHDEYLGYVRGWYQKVAEKINPYLITKGGPIFCIQVENEYDHLMLYGKDKISLEDGIEYFNRLSKMMDDLGIDIPQFANEAAFLRGRGKIIDTRTYYPNIPCLTNWMYQHHHFDDKIAAAKIGQPNCPTMILELQVGWFSQFGQPFYVPDVNLTESVSKSALISGASFLNYYMFVGGTTFPYWGCRGDHEDAVQGIGTGTTFDFGGAPIREWGELMDGRRDWMKAFMLFCHHYQDLLLESENIEDFEVLSGGEDIQVISSKEAKADISLGNPAEKFKLLAKQRNGERLLCVRNLSEETRIVDIGSRASGEVIFRGLKVPPRETFLFPLGVKVPHTEVTVIRATSELLFSKKVGTHALFGFYGKPGRKGEIILDVPAREIKVLSGEIKVQGDKSATLTFTHGELLIAEVREHLLFILDYSLAGKVEELEKGLLIADIYFVKDIQEEKAAVLLKTEMRTGVKTRFFYFGEPSLSGAEVSGKALTVKPEAGGAGTSFSYENSTDKLIQVTWKDAWKVQADTAEAKSAYDDSQWQELPRPISLEEAELLEHGYIWYRGEFTLPKEIKEVSLLYPGNATDRQYLYLNGKLLWGGITKAGKREEVPLQGIAQAGKNTLAVLYVNNFHNKSHPHEGDVCKYSGITQAVLVEGIDGAGKSFRAEVTSFKVREQLQGLLDGCTELSYDDAAWLKVPQAKRYNMREELGALIWLRRKFSYHCPSGSKGALRLIIPDLEERCTLYVNGKPLGQFEAVGPQHEFYIPETFLETENVLAVVLEGSGGYFKEMELNTFYETQEIEVKLLF